MGTLKVRGKVAELSFEVKCLQKPRKAKKFVKIRLRYFCTILYRHVNFQPYSQLKSEHCENVEQN